MTFMFVSPYIKNKSFQAYSIFFGLIFCFFFLTDGLLSSSAAASVKCGRIFESGMRNFNDGEFETAVSYFKDVIKSGASPLCKIKSHYKIAEIHIADSPPQKKEAKIQFSEIFKLNDNYFLDCQSGKINKLLCGAYTEAKPRKPVKAQANKLPEPKKPIEKKEIIDFFVLCKKKFESKNFKEAIPLCEEAIIKNPKNSDGYNFLARSFFLTQDSYNTKRILEKLLKIEPDHIEGNLLFANISLNRSIKEASDHADNVLRVAPKNSEAHSIKGKIFYLEAKFNQAIEQFQIALKADGNNASTYFTMGEAYFKLGRISDALLEYEAAVLLDKDNKKFQDAYIKAKKKVTATFF